MKLILILLLAYFIMQTPSLKAKVIPLVHDVLTTLADKVGGLIDNSVEGINDSAKGAKKSVKKTLSLG